MKFLPPLDRPAALVSLDFDGTLHDPAEDPPIPRRLFSLLRRLHDQHHVAWGINTGRSMGHLLDGLSESACPILPDWVVAREREIYLPGRHGQWREHEPWNERGAAEIQALFARAAGLLARIRREVEHHTGARWLEFDGEPAGFISRTAEEMDWIVRHITPIAAAEPALSWQRNSIYLRFGHHQFHKGSSLSELARLYQVPAARCFAMGDGHNDFEMLDPQHAGMAACPSNSVPEIRLHVARRGGFIAASSHGHAAVEALQRFFPLPPA